MQKLGANQVEKWSIKKAGSSGLPSLSGFVCQDMSQYSEPFSTSEIHEITVGQLDIREKRRFTNYKTRNPGGGVRGEIRELSRQSRSRLLYKARNMPGLACMVTHTYPHEDYAATATGGDFMRDGKAVKEHFRKLRQLYTYRGFYGFWFLEFQKRGAPHMHICLSGVPQDQERIKKTWYKMVGSTCEYHEEMGVDFQVLREKHAAGAYAAKYSTKDEQKTVPERYEKVGRFWGVFGKIPNSQALISLPTRAEVFKLMRLARNAQKAHYRAAGLAKPSSSKGNRGPGRVLYNAAPAILFYLESRYRVSGSHAEIVISAPQLHTSASKRLE